MLSNLKESKKLIFNSWNLNIDTLSFEDVDYYIAIENFLLDDDDLSINADNFEKIHFHAHFYIEVLHQLCNAKNWELIDSILNFTITTTTETEKFSLSLSEFFLFKNLFTKILEVTNEINRSFQDEPDRLVCTQILKAKALGGIGNLSDSIDIYSQLLSRDIDPLLNLEINTYLVVCKVQSEKFSESIPVLVSLLKLVESFSHQDSISNSEKAKLLVLKAQLLGNFGYCEMNLNNFEDAINYYNESLYLLKENNNISLIVNPLVHQGIILRKLFRANESIVILKQAMATALEIDNEENLIWIYNHLSWALRIEKRCEEAKSYALMSLEGYRRVNDDRGINDCHELLGWIFIDEGENNDAVNKFETALKWRRKENRPQGMASCMIGLAIAYLRQGKVLKFIKMVFAGLESYHKAGILNWTRIFRMLNFIVIFRHLLRKSK